MTKKQKDKRNKAHGGKGRKAQPKVARLRGVLTLRQSRFAQAFLVSKTAQEAALKAGYSPKNPAQSANQALILKLALEVQGGA